MDSLPSTPLQSHGLAPKNMLLLEGPLSAVGVAQYREHCLGVARRACQLSPPDKLLEQRQWAVAMVRSRSFDIHQAWAMALPYSLGMAWP